MIDFISQSFFISVDFVKEHSVYFILLLNLYSVFMISKISARGWFIKLIMDIYFFYIFTSNYIHTPSSTNLNLLLNEFVFMGSHLYGFISWSLFKKKILLEASK